MKNSASEAPNLMRKAEKHRQILEAAVRAFSKWGYHACTMNKVAKEAGVADGTLYLYVKSKEDLLVSSFKHVIEGMMETLDRELALLVDPVSKLELLIRLHFGIMESDPDMAGFLQFHLRQPDREIRNAIREPLIEYARRIEGVIEEGKELGVFRKNLGTRTVRRIVFGAMDETVNSWFYNMDAGPLSQKVKPLIEALLYGILEAPGRNANKKGGLER